MLRASLGTRSQSPLGASAPRSTTPFRTGVDPLRSDIAFSSAADETGYMQAARDFNQRLLGLTGDTQAADNGMDVPQQQTGVIGAYVDPWTGNVVRGVRTSTTPTTEYGPGDTEVTAYRAEDPWKDLYLRGAGGRFGGETANWSDIVSGLPEGQREALTAEYQNLQNLRQRFNERYLPETLRSQVGQLIPETPSAKHIGNRDFGVNKITANLAARGITDMSQLGVSRDERGNPVYFDKATGNPLFSGIATFQGGRGEGNIDYRLRSTPDGRVYIDTHFEKPEARLKPEDLGLMALSAFAAPAVGGALASSFAPAMGSVAGNALGQGLSGAGMSALQGSDPLKGALAGAAGGALAGAGNVGGRLLGGNAPAWQQAAINQGLGGAVRGGLQAGLTGGNVGLGALTGGLGGAVSGGLGAYGNALTQGQNPFMQGLGRVGTSALSGGVQNVLRGQDFLRGLQSGALGGLQGVASGELSRLAQSQGLDPLLARQLGGFGGRMLTQQLAKG